MCDFAAHDLTLLKKRLHVAPKSSFSSPNPTTRVKRTPTARTKSTRSDSSLSSSIHSSVPPVATSSSAPLPWYLMTAEQIYEHESKLQKKEQKDKSKAAKLSSSAGQCKTSPVQRNSISARRESTMAKLKETRHAATRSDQPMSSPRKSASTPSTSTILTPKALSNRKLRSTDVRQRLQSVDTDLASLTSSAAATRQQLRLNYDLISLQQQEIALTKEKLTSIYDAAINYLRNNSASHISDPCNNEIDVSIFTLSKRHHSKRHKHYSSTNATTTTKQMLRAESILRRHERFEYLWSVVRTFIRAIGRTKVLEKRKADRHSSSNNNNS